MTRKKPRASQETRNLPCCKGSPLVAPQVCIRLSAPARACASRSGIFWQSICKPAQNLLWIPIRIVAFFGSPDRGEDIRSTASLFARLHTNVLRPVRDGVRAFSTGPEQFFYR